VVHVKKIKLKFTKNRLVIIGLIFLVLLASAGMYALRNKGKQSPTPAPEPVYSQITGREVEPDIAERPILAVLIENSEAARPQTGLGSAGIVIETTTEGGITRFLALYQEEMPEIVGPVRSLRIPFLNIAMGFDASIAHVGGSPEALKLVEQRKPRTLNQFTYDAPYYRDNNRQAPHNMYGRISALRGLQSELDHDKSQFADIPRSDGSANAEPQADTINIDFSTPEFRVQYRYDTVANNYTRYLAGQPHIDAATKESIISDNIIIVRTDGDKIIGSGKALVFKNGEVISASWDKPQYSKRIKIVDSENNEVPLNRGKTWFAMLPTDKTVIY
jgi:hypothetical protein